VTRDRGSSSCLPRDRDERGGLKRTLTFLVSYTGELESVPESLPESESESTMGEYHSLRE
jgi:hypothetical protein